MNSTQGSTSCSNAEPGTESDSRRDLRDSASGARSNERRLVADGDAGGHAESGEDAHRRRIAVCIWRENRYAGIARCLTGVRDIHEARGIESDLIWLRELGTRSRQRRRGGKIRRVVRASRRQGVRGNR